MSFMDPKEEVLDIELTQYGKYLLSKGKFKPAYYAFFDDDVLYDTEWSGYVENQNSSEERIIKETPQIKAQYLFHGAETEVKKINELVRSNVVELGSEKIQPTQEKNYASSAPLGNSSLESLNAPSFDIKFLEGELSGSVYFLTGSYQMLKIPQLSSSIAFKTFVGSENEEVLEGENIRKFSDGTFIKVEKDSILLQIDEKSIPFENENFDIEVFVREEYSDNKIVGKKREQLIPLSFVKRKTNINSSLVLDEKELEENFPELDSSYVEYYLDIDVDNEIERSLLCKGRSEEQKKNIFADKTLDCLGEEKIKIKNIFDKEIEEFEDCD